MGFQGQVTAAFGGFETIDQIVKFSRGVDRGKSALDALEELEKEKESGCAAVETTERCDENRVRSVSVAKDCSVTYGPCYDPNEESIGSLT